MSRPPSPEVRPEPSFAGSVVLDIAGEVGALVVHTSPEMAGWEIDLVPASRRECVVTHTAVRERRLGERPGWSAVYPSVLSGEWSLVAPDGGRRRVTVVGGRVNEMAW